LIDLFRRILLEIRKARFKNAKLLFQLGIVGNSYVDVLAGRGAEEPTCVGDRIVRPGIFFK
jgi:mannitol/fructose-specific phosphotransferase system IIA component